MPDANRELMLHLGTIARRANAVAQEMYAIDEAVNGLLVPLRPEMPDAETDEFWDAFWDEVDEGEGKPSQGGAGDLQRRIDALAVFIAEKVVGTGDAVEWNDAEGRWDYA